MTERMVKVLRVLAEADAPLTGNQIGHSIGFRTGSDRHAHDGRMMGAANRVISCVRSLERLGYVSWARRPDGMTGSAHRITEAGRVALRDLDAAS